MIAIGIERPNPVVQATTKTEFATAFESVTNIIFAYAGHVGILLLHLRVERPEGLSKGFVHASGLGYFHVYYRVDRDISVWRTRCVISVAWFNSANCSGSGLWHCFAHSEFPDLDMVSGKY